MLLGLQASRMGQVRSWELQLRPLNRARLSSIRTLLQRRGIVSRSCSLEVSDPPPPPACAGLLVNISDWLLGMALLAHKDIQGIRPTKACPASQKLTLPGSMALHQRDVLQLTLLMPAIDHKLPSSLNIHVADLGYFQEQWAGIQISDPEHFTTTEASDASMLLL